jgi:nucleotide-binding universal stress UspA family protein
MSAVQPASTVAVPKLELKHILVTTDFSDFSRSALRQAAAIARLHGSDLVVLHVVSPEPMINTALEPATWKYETVLQQARDEMSAAEKDTIADVKHDYLVETGSLKPVLDKVIKDRDISLLVLGTHGRTGLKKIFLGSVAEQIYRLADCPVMTIGPDIEPKLLTHGRFESVLFATDFTAGSKHALPFALGFAAESHARFTLLHVLEEGSVAAMYLHDQLAQNARRQLETMVPAHVNVASPPDVEIVGGYPVEEILRVARKNQTDLIVLGVHSASGIGSRTSAHLPWTIASTVVCHAKCPVLTVRG